jgi:hypothetical protein
VALMRCLAACRLAAAQSPVADPQSTRQALGVLFAVANEVIPKTSTCHGDYGQRGRPTLGDLLSMQLAYFYRGDNVVSGHCAGEHPRQCSVTISRSFGEDVSSARIGFAVRNGKLSVSSLTCVATP